MQALLIFLTGIAVGVILGLALVAAVLAALNTLGEHE